VDTLTSKRNGEATLGKEAFIDHLEKLTSLKLKPGTKKEVIKYGIPGNYHVPELPHDNISRNKLQLIE
jgi:hypothetical protein